jgi:hypothetical protein
LAKIQHDPQTSIFGLFCCSAKHLSNLTVDVSSGGPQDGRRTPDRNRKRKGSDPRFKEPEIYGERYEWDIEGRRLCGAFPGANIRTAGVYTKTTRVGLVIEILSNPDLPPKLTTKDISRLIEAKTGRRTPWRTVSSNVLTADFSRALEAIGWRYVPGRGRGGSHFERTQPILIQAA